MSVGVIAPDEASGRAFVAKLDQVGIVTVVFYPTIAPRVIGEVINRDPRVARDLQMAVDQAVGRGVEKIVIACNTLQLWIPLISSPVPVLTTFQALKAEYPDRARRPLYLGTTALVQAISNDFDTLLSLGNDRLQRLVQEIIWRVKAVEGSDYRTAFVMDKPEDRAMLIAQTQKLERELHLMGMDRAILGCTELPLAFGQDYVRVVDGRTLELIDPADVVTRFIKSK